MRHIFGKLDLQVVAYFTISLSRIQGRPSVVAVLDCQCTTTLPPTSAMSSIRGTYNCYRLDTYSVNISLYA